MEDSLKYSRTSDCLTSKLSTSHLKFLSFLGIQLKSFRQILEAAQKQGASLFALEMVPAPQQCTKANKDVPEFFLNAQWRQNY